MTGGPGYSIQSGGMDDEARSLDTAGDDVADIKKAITDLVCYGPDMLGGSDAGPAYNRFSAAWQAEAQTLKGALHELADKIRVSKAGYHTADHDAVAGLTTAVADRPPGSTPAPAPSPSPFG